MFQFKLDYRRFILRLIAAFCALLMLLSVFPVSIFAETAEERYFRLQGELAVLSEKILDTQENLDDAETLRDSLEQERAVLDEMIEISQGDIEITRAELEGKEEKMAEQREALQEAEEVFGQRLVAMYTINNANTLSSLFSVDSFTGFMQMIDAMRRISKEDSELIGNIQQQQAELQQEQDEVQALLLELEESYDDLEANANALAGNIRAQDAEISEQDALLEANEDAYGATAAEAEIAYQEMLAASNALAGIGSAPGEGSAGTETSPEPAPEPVPESTVPQEPDASNGATAPESTVNSTPQPTPEPEPVPDPAPPATNGITTWPVPSSRRLTCYYGEPDPAGRPHLGLDIAAPLNTPIVAAGSGTVIIATSHYSYGNYLVIDHGNGLKTLYAHCNSLLVGVGTSVSAGDTIALMGNTGYSFGSHLHFEVHNPSRQDPLGYLS